MRHSTSHTWSIIILIGLTFFITSVTTAHPVHAASSKKATFTQPQGIVTGTSYNGPSAVYCNGLEYVGYYHAYRGTDNHINAVYESGTGLDLSTVFTDTTSDTPAVACFLGHIYFAWKANDPSNRILIGYSNGLESGSVLLNRTTIPGQSTNRAPALGVSSDGSIMYAAWKGNTNNSLSIEQTTDGVHWYNRTVLNDTAVDGPALTNFQGKLYVAWPGTDSTHHVWLGYYADNNPNLFNHTAITSEETSLRVGLSVYNNRLQLALKGDGSNSRVYTGSWIPGNYVGNGPFSGAYTNNPPALNGGNLYFTGTDNNINQVQVYG